MSIVELDCDSVIRSIVEGMLPRFSDNQLGLYMELDLDLTDHGYGTDGNTLEREALSVRRHLHFLFNRSNNYTRVFFLQPKPGERMVNRTIVNEWTMTCDHDSCWSSDGIRNITDIHFEMYNQFDGRMISGKPLNMSHLYCHNHFWSHPCYVKLDTFEQKDKSAKRYSKESNVWNIKFSMLRFSDLESLFGENIYKTGLLIVGSEDHDQQSSRSIMQ